jgi:hypothetical protein
LRSGLPSGIDFAFCRVTLVGAGSPSSSKVSDPPGGTAITLPGAIVEDASDLFFLRVVFLILMALFFLLEVFKTSQKQQGKQH